ncbi:MAG: hypothetical protein AAFU73_14235 [Planctomycetota bacterium]
MFTFKTLREAALATAFATGLATAADAQTLRFDGIENSSLGDAQLNPDANGHLVVSNIGSSGQDGVRIELGEGEGVGLEAYLELGPNGSCDLEARAGRADGPQLANLGLEIRSDGTPNGALYTPDFSALGASTYSMRVMAAGAVVYEGDGHSGATRMHGTTGLNSLPQKVYMLAMPFGPWGGAFLECVDHGGGGVIVTPPGGTPIAADFVEFRTDPGQVTGVESVEFTARDAASDLEILNEELRQDVHWVQSLGDANLDAESGGRLTVSNIGSSGQDGVSIQLPDETDEVFGELLLPSTAPATGGSIGLSSECRSGERTAVLVTSTAGQWELTPDFSAVGSPTYTLELHHQGSVVFTQQNMTGPAVSRGAWSLFYKKTTTHPDGSVTTEWCIGGSASAHQVSGGPTVLADMVTLRSEAVSVGDARPRTVELTGTPEVEPMQLLSIDEPSGCVGDSYCQGAINSTGTSAKMCSSGSSSVAANDLVLECFDLPPLQFGLYFYGASQAWVPLGPGHRCVGGQLFRLPVTQSSVAGVASYALDNTFPPEAAGQISASDTWYFQFWHRDFSAIGFNLSDAHAVTFTP